MEKKDPKRELLKEYKKLIKKGIIEVRPFNKNKWSEYSFKKSSYMLGPHYKDDGEDIMIIEEDIKELEKDPRSIDPSINVL